MQRQTAGRDLSVTCRQEEVAFNFMQMSSDAIQQRPVEGQTCSPFVLPLQNFFSLLIPFFQNIRKKINAVIAHFPEEYNVFLYRNKNTTAEVIAMPIVSFVRRYCIFLMNILAKILVNNVT